MTLNEIAQYLKDNNYDPQQYSINKTYVSYAGPLIYKKDDKFIVAVEERATQSPCGVFTNEEEAVKEFVKWINIHFNSTHSKIEL